VQTGLLIGRHGNERGRRLTNSKSASVPCRICMAAEAWGLEALIDERARFMRI
jgi:hypothetical protein